MPYGRAYNLADCNRAERANAVNPSYYTANETARFIRAYVRENRLSMQRFAQQVGGGCNKSGVKAWMDAQHRPRKHFPRLVEMGVIPAPPEPPPDQSFVERELRLVRVLDRFGDDVVHAVRCMQASLREESASGTGEFERVTKSIMTPVAGVKEAKRPVQPGSVT